MQDNDDVKNLSKSTYIWSHIAVIIFHTLLGALLISTFYYNKLGNIDSKIIVLIIGIILVLMSLGSLAPILMNYNKIVIE